MHDKKTLSNKFESYLPYIGDQIKNGTIISVGEIKTDKNPEEYQFPISNQTGYLLFSDVYYNRSHFLKWMKGEDFPIPEELQFAEKEENEGSSLTDQNSLNTFEEFVNGLLVEQYDDEQISFKEPHKDKIPVHAKLLGFKKPNGLTWKDLLSVLNNKDLTINTKGTDSRAARKRVQEIGKKLINFISVKFKIEHPKGFKLFEVDKTKGDGVYRFKFKLKQSTPSTKAYCLENFFKLAKQYQDNSTHDLRTLIEIRGKEYLSKGYITKAEIIEAISLK